MHQFDGAVVMGILNLTPDSFYAGSRIEEKKALLKRASEMVSEGAKILDIGGYSSRPGAEDISAELEGERIRDAVLCIADKFPNTLISVDTFRSSVARIGLENGAHIINDITGGHADPEILKVVAEYNAAYILMHMKGTPQNMMNHTDYEDILKEMKSYFSDSIRLAKSAGIDSIMIDPGFGFSKTVEQNLFLLKNLDRFLALGHPILAGISRKSTIYKTLQINADDSLNGTTVLNSLCLAQGAAILRVHDVKEAGEAIQLANAIRDAV